MEHLEGPGRTRKEPPGRTASYHTGRNTRIERNLGPDDSIRDLYTALLKDDEERALDILNGHPEFAKMACEDPDRYGESPLHLAIFNRNYRLVQELVIPEYNADTNARCTGTRFSTAQGTKEEDVLFYYGEYVLSLAACLGMKDIVRCLVEHGARLDNTDSKGNTVLHVLATMEHADCSMAKLVLELVEKQLKTLEEQLDSRQISQDDFDQRKEKLDLGRVENDRGLTPLKLAAASANLEMFQFLVKSNQRVLWKYGDASECLYDLSEIDTFSTDTRPQTYSLLEVAVFSDVYRLYYNIKASRMIEATPIKQLLEEKWRCVRWWFWAFAVIYFIHIIIFTACCYYRPLQDVVKNVSDNVTVTVVEKVPVFESYNTPGHRARGAGELFTVITSLTFVLGFFVFEPAKRLDFMIEHYSMKTSTYIFFNAFGYGIGNGPFRFVSPVYVLAVVTLMILRLANLPCEDVVMSIALVFGWMLMLYFARGSEHLGPFTIIIHRILMKDVFRFFLVYLVCLAGYTTAFYVTFQQATEDLEQFSDFGNTFFTLFKLTIGVEDIAVLNKAPNPIMAVILFVSFLIFSFLLMANLLIAIMGETLGVVSDAGWKNLWKLQRASLIILFEQRYRWCLRCVPRRLMQFVGEHVDDLMVHPNTRYLKVRIRGKPEAGRETKLTPPDRHEDPVPEAPSRCCGGCFRVAPIEVDVPVPQT
ncbi:Transient receptor putative cation channel sub V member 6 [Branchiostoma belcheri]|nr:Transient receptor putative cation channel sub V member 6 [Branchiostoma belcheri]